MIETPTKLAQCASCKYCVGVGCHGGVSCHHCNMYSKEPLIAAGHVDGLICHCKCLTIDLSSPCPYYKEVVDRDV